MNQPPRIPQLDPLCTVTREEMIGYMQALQERDARIAAIPEGPNRQAQVEAIRKEYVDIEPFFQ